MSRFLFIKLFLLSICFSGATLVWAQKDISEQAWRQIKTLKGIPTKAGMTARSVFVFFDPNCPYCAKLWQAKINNQTFREIPAVWIPVTYLGDSALGKGAALLRTGSPSSLEQNFTKFDYEKRQGGIDSVVATDKEKRELGQAKAVWMDLGAATPLIVYRHKNGKISSMLGLPSDEKLSEISNQFAPSFLSVLPSK